MKRLFLALIFAGGIVFQAHASDGLSRFQGAWQGQGWALNSPGSNRENIKCRIKASYIPPSKRLVVKGKCAVPGRNFNMQGTVSEAKAGTVAGRWSNPFGPGSTAVSGKITSSGLSLNVSAPAKRGGKAVPHRMVWSKTSDGFVLTSRNLAAAEAVSRVEFRR